MKPKINSKKESIIYMIDFKKLFLVFLVILTVFFIVLLFVDNKNLNNLSQDVLLVEAVCLVLSPYFISAQL